MDIKEKQARWAVERPLFEAEFIHSHLLPFFRFNENTGDYEIKDECLNTDTSEDRRLAYETLNTGWVMWLRAKRNAKAQAVPEGFVLVPKDNLSVFWQDSDEPENFCSSEADFNCLGDCIDIGEIMEINKFTQANINKEKLFGTWFAEAINPTDKANFFVGTKEECEEIVQKNKAMIEAQEQDHA